MRGKSSQTLAVLNVFDLFLNATILAFSGVIAHQYQFRAYASSAGHDRGHVCPSPPHKGGLRYPQVESARQRQPCSGFCPAVRPGLHQRGRCQLAGTDQCRMGHLFCRTPPFECATAMQESQRQGRLLTVPACFVVSYCPRSDAEACCRMFTYSERSGCQQSQWTRPDPAWRTQPSPRHRSSRPWQPWQSGRSSGG